MTIHLGPIQNDLRSHTVCCYVALMSVLITGCGRDAGSGPSGAHTQARIDANDSWFFYPASRPNSFVSDVNTLGRIIELGPGEQCGRGRLSLARRPPPVAGSFLTVTVGQNSQTTRDPNREITVCGSGPAR